MISLCRRFCLYLTCIRLFPQITRLVRVIESRSDSVTQMSSPLGPNAIEGEGGQLINNESLVTSPPDVPTTGAEGPASLSVVDTNLGSQRLQTPLNWEELVEPDVARRLTPEKLSHSQRGDTKSAIELEDNTSTPTTNSADLSLFAGGDELNYRSDDTPCLLG